MEPKVSVIVPVYNVEKYLYECMDSILGQTLKEIEIICVDDGSADSSGKILDEYAAKDKRIRVIHKENSGYGASMNVGLQHARGEYVAILESDDFAEPNMMELLYRTISEQGVDIVKSAYYRYGDGKNVLSQRLGNVPKHQIVSKEKCPQILELADTIWSAMYRRGFLLENMITFHETPGASFQDISFALMCWLAAERVYFIPDALVHYRTDNPGSSMHAPGKTFNVFDEYHRVEKWLEQNEITQRLYCRFMAVKYTDYLNHYHRVAGPYQFALLCRLSEELEQECHSLHQEDFEEEYWTQIQDILESKERFFLKTGKAIYDNRLQFCDFANGGVYFEACLERWKEYENVVVYGAGKIGQRLVKKLQNEGIDINYFAVTNKHIEQSECMGFPVIGIDDIVDASNDTAIIIAVAERSQYELYENCRHLKNIDIFVADDAIRKNI